MGIVGSPPKILSQVHFKDEDNNLISLRGSFDHHHLVAFEQALEEGGYCSFEFGNGGFFTLRVVGLEVGMHTMEYRQRWAEGEPI